MAAGVSLAGLRVGVRFATANDLKLSDGGGWRAGCMVGGKAAAEAASVTAVAVRCSAWLGDVRFGKLMVVELRVVVPQAMLERLGTRILPVPR